MARKTAPKTKPTEEMMERTFIRALDYAAAAEISLETALTHFVPQTAAALAAYAARRAPELLAQRSPHHLAERLLIGDWHPGDVA
jgi:hypothetical protein